MEEENKNSKHISKLFEKAEETNVKVAELSVLVQEGFKGIHRRQDITNGRIASVEEDTKEIETKASANTRRIKEFSDFQKTQKEIVSEQKENRKWLKREVITTLLSVISVVLTAAILLVLGLKN